MEKLNIIVDREATAEEMESIRMAFSDSFDTKVDNQIVRLSEGCELPLLVNITVNVMSNAIYAGLVFGLTKLFAEVNTKRKLAVVIHLLKNGEQIILGKKYNALRKNGKDMEFPSREALFVFLKERNKQPR